jgi:two-component system LytT family response regulator
MDLISTFCPSIFSSSTRICDKNGDTFIRLKLRKIPIAHHPGKKIERFTARENPGMHWSSQWGLWSPGSMRSAIKMKVMKERAAAGRPFRQWHPPLAYFVEQQLSQVKKSAIFKPQVKVTAIIVDDEMPARENLSLLLEEFCPEVEVMAKAGNITDAREKILSLQPQVVFLDIRMPSGTEGFELLDSIPDKKFLVIFVTAFKDYAIRAFNANAVYYVLKPVDIDELKLSVKKVSDQLAKGEQGIKTYYETIRELSDSIRHQKYSSRITIHHSKGIKIVNDADLVYLEADGNCTQLFFADGSKYLDTRTLAVYEQLLNPQHFFRIHKSHIINLNFLTEYLHDDGNHVLLKNGTKLAVARNRVPDFLKKIREL